MCSNVYTHAAEGMCGGRCLWKAGRTDRWWRSTRKLGPASTRADVAAAAAVLSAPGGERRDK